MIFLKVSKNYCETEILVYLDDIIVFTSDLKQHNKKFRRLFNRLKEARTNFHFTFVFVEKVH